MLSMPFAQFRGYAKIKRRSWFPKTTHPPSTLPRPLLFFPAGVDCILSSSLPKIEIMKVFPVYKAASIYRIIIKIKENSLAGFLILLSDGCCLCTEKRL